MAEKEYIVTILDRYLLKQFTKNMIMVLAAFTAIYILVDFFERIDEFIQAGKPLSLAGRYFFLKIPFMIDQIIPVSILLAGVITLGLLNHNGELTALKAGGVYMVRITVPIVIGASFFTLFALVNSEWLLPPTLADTNRILYEEVRGEIPKGIARNNRFFYNGKHGFYSFIRPDPLQTTYESFSYASWDKEYQLQQLLTAATAQWTQEDGWTFFQCQIKTLKPDGFYKISTHTVLKKTLPETPEDFFVPEYKIKEQSLSELYIKSKSVVDGKNNEAMLQLYKKLSYGLLGLPLMLLGLPILLIVHQRWGRDLTLAIPLSCGLAFVAWGCWGALQSFAGASYIHPLFSAWSIHLVITIVAISLLRRQDS
jgi:lipopolysaccharide export system permease protein